MLKDKGQGMDDILIRMQHMLSDHQNEIATLSEEMYRQHQEISALRKELGRLKDALKASADQGSDPSAHLPEPPPPHY
tara:strand:+ start:1237 stop:1470 length:234 start_codon:yes stop_codon:yes gene_type:complete